MKNILDITYFNEIVKGIKAMKADMVCVYNNILIGTDNTMSNLITYNLDIQIPLTPITIITKELSSEFYSNITDTTIVFDFDNCKIYCENNKVYAEKRITPMINTTITQKLIQMYINNYHNTIMNNMYEERDITNDVNFEFYRNMKSSDGAQVYLPFGDYEYGMYLFSGSIPLNKSDKVSLIIHDQGETFIANFRVYKKKLNPINIYYRFIKIKNMLIKE